MSTSTKAVINITERAAMRIMHLMEMRNKPAFGIRIGVSAGGCAGFEYKMEYADEADCADEIIVYKFAENKTFKYNKNTEMKTTNKKPNSETDDEESESDNEDNENMEESEDSDSYQARNRLEAKNKKQSSVVKKLGDIKILISPKAIIYLIGTEIDYVKDKFASGFTFRNPRQKNTCGCGKSFNV